MGVPSDVHSRRLRRRPCKFNMSKTGGALSRWTVAFLLLVISLISVPLASGYTLTANLTIDDTPIRNARVELRGTTSGMLVEGKTTDAYGVVSFTNVSYTDWLYVRVYADFNDSGYPNNVVFQVKDPRTPPPGCARTPNAVRYSLSRFSCT